MKNNSKKIRNDLNFDLPRDYVVSKFYELGYRVTHNKYNNTYNGCCPICREGKSWGKKKRCFYIPEDEVIYCHNGDCGWSSKPYKWIREVSKMTHDELWADVEEGAYEFSDVFVEKEKIKLPSLPDDSINLFDPVQVAFYIDNNKVQTALDFIKRRRLATAINAPDAFYISLKDFTHKNRLVIPFKDELGKIIFYQSRKIFEWDEKPNYISKIGGEKSICGIDKVSTNYDTIFLFEGPIDSFFVRNGIGLAGINIGKGQYTPKQEEQMESLKFFEKIWVLDSQWKDKTAREKTEILIDQGQKVFIWPEKFGTKFKDLNELCIHHGIDEISPDFIQKNSSKGVSATVQLKLLMSKL